MLDAHSLLHVSRLVVIVFLVIEIEDPDQILVFAFLVMLLFGVYRQSFVSSVFFLLFPVFYYVNFPHFLFTASYWIGWWKPDLFDHISKSCYYHIRQLCCIRPYLDSKTASTIATSIVHSKLDYCNSLPQPAQVLDHPAPTDPELCCTCRYQSSLTQSYHSHPSVSALVTNN